MDIGFLFKFAIGICLVWAVARYFVRRQRRQQMRKLAHDVLNDDTPDATRGKRYLETRFSTPRFYSSWDEALNRPIPVSLLFRIQYADADGVVTERDIEPRALKVIPSAPHILIIAFCHLRGEERSFRSDRVIEAVNLQSKRQIGDLGDYLRRKF